MRGERLSLRRSWVVGERIGSGGFGSVYTATADDGTKAAAKFVPKEPGADRELLFVNLANVRNVIPVIDSGEYLDSWVLVMPLADASLRDYLEQSGGTLSIEETVAVLSDIVDALSDLENQIVHRDLKPENILRLDGKWHLADFGIARYAEASTAPDTRKHALSPHYAAPERWRSEHATLASDIYALGIIAYELLAGHRPFGGGTVEDLRQAHLHAEPPTLEGVPIVLATLVDECLYKAAPTRPTPKNFRERLNRFHEKTTAAPGLMQLQEANHAEVRRRAEQERRASEARTTEDRRRELFSVANRGLGRWSDRLRSALAESAPSGTLSTRHDGSWSLRLGSAELSLSSIEGHHGVFWGGWTPPAFDVVAFVSLRLRIQTASNAYNGRSHSVWFGDIQETGQYGWFETAFMATPIAGHRGMQEPFALSPGQESAKAVWGGIAEYQVAWPFSRIYPEDLDELVSRWGGWLGQAATGKLRPPSVMPERPVEGTWRRS
ncbi:serine/threonine-protein kinase [Rhodococcus indonesiensis]